MSESAIRSILITGADGYLGRLLVRALAQGSSGITTVVATDLRLPPPARRWPSVHYHELDVRSPEAASLMRRYRVDSVVHLAAVLDPGKGMGRDLLYDVEVRGTENIVSCCLEAGVGHLVVTSSGAAYGYYADNPVPLDEDDPLRGNESFAYAHHKRLVEQMLARFRTEHPELRQLVLRPGFILGQTTRNPITALFDKPALVGLSGTESPFVIIWDEDVVGVILLGLGQAREGRYNLAGDGVLSLRQMAAMMGKPYVEVPPALLERSLGVLHRLGLSRFGSEHVDFIRYRPVLGNRRLKEELGYRLRMTSRQVFELYLRGRGLGPVPGAAKEMEP